ncbi:MAG: RNA polymerase sigma factor, partial [Planctomycetota bacterium]
GVASPRTLNIRGELADVLREAIDNLPPSCREVVDLFGEESLDRKAIAERLGVQRETIDRRFARAYEALREEIQRHVTSLVTGRPGERRRVTWADVSTLRPSFRKVFAVRHLEGTTNEEVSKRLGVPLETVEARLAAAYEQLSCSADDDFSEAREGYRRSL